MEQPDKFGSQNDEGKPSRQIVRSRNRARAKKKIVRPRVQDGPIAASETSQTAEPKKRQSSAKPKADSPQRRRATARRRETRVVALELLKPDPNNPRRHSRIQIRKLARGIEAFGFNTVIVVDRDFTIVVGHGRYEALKLLGEKQVRVIILDDLTPDEIKAYAIADNRLSDLSAWDDEALALRLKELSEIELTFEIEATGFEAPEIELRIQALDGDDDGLDLADEYEGASGPPVTRVGEMWFAAQHIVAQGDARDQELLAALLKGEEIAGVFADPPYNVKIAGNVSGLGRVKHREFAMASGEMSKPEFTDFLTRFLANARTHSRQGAVFYVCVDWRHVAELSVAAEATGFEVLNICVWVKPNGGMGSFYRSRHEFVFVLRAPGGANVNNVQLGRFGRNRTNVWNYPGANGFPRRGKRRALELHPTAKPVRMVADAIRDCTDKGDVVLDPFLGAGATLLACERTGRRCRAVELDPLYIDAAIERWQRMTGKTAIHASGETFDEIRAARRQGDGEA